MPSVRSTHLLFVRLVLRGDLGGVVGSEPLGALHKCLVLLQFTESFLPATERQWDTWWGSAVRIARPLQ